MTTTELDWGELFVEKNTYGGHKFNWPRKPNKFGATTCVDDEGGSFPSKLERAVWRIHRTLEKAGAIGNLRRYPSVVLRASRASRGNASFKWKADMTYETKSGKHVIVEAKGCEGPHFRRVQNSLQKHGVPEGYDRVEIWRGSYTRPFLRDQDTYDKEGLE